MIKISQWYSYILKFIIISLITISSTSAKTIIKEYVSKQGDTLKKVSYKLYGKQKFWKRLLKNNSMLRSKSPSTILDTDTLIFYTAPLIKRKYTVRSGDTISRIIEWKYSQKSSRKNALKHVRTKNAFYSDLNPGDKIYFNSNGTFTTIKRIKKTFRYYKIQNGDTLKIISYKLQGKKNIWSKLLKLNKTLRPYHRDEKLPLGLKIRYLAPILKTKYLVKNGDTLSRISLWKYGSTKYLKNILKKNTQYKKNPHFIYIGDKVDLTNGMIIQNQKIRNNSTKLKKKIVIRNNVINSNKNSIDVTRNIPNPIPNILQNKNKKSGKHGDNKVVYNKHLVKKSKKYFKSKDVLNDTNSSTVKYNIAKVNPSNKNEQQSTSIKKFINKLTIIISSIYNKVSKTINLTHFIYFISVLISIAIYFTVVIIISRIKMKKENNIFKAKEAPCGENKNARIKFLKELLVIDNNSKKRFGHLDVFFNKLRRKNKDKDKDKDS